jgi:WD40 repeat protein
MVGLMAARVASALFPEAARAAACSTGAFAHEILVGNLSFFPDGTTLITAGRDMFVKFWTIPNGALFRTIATSNVPYSLAVSPDGHWIAVGMAQGDLELWAADGSNQRTLRGHQDTVGSVAFTPNSQKLLSASLDATTKVWSVGSATLLQSFTDTTGAMRQVAVTPQGRFLTSASGTQVYLRLLADGKTLATRPGTVLALSPDGGLLAAHDSQTLYLRAFPSLDPIASVAEPLTATALAFSGDGKFVAACYGASGARLYSAPGLKLVSGLGASDGLSLSLDMDSQGRYFAVASGKGIQLYSLPQGARVPVCFMDVAASSPTASGELYALGGLHYSVPCGVAIPAGAVCSCNCVPGFCACVQDTGCGCVSDSGCDCVSDTGCGCNGDSGCDCVSDFVCGCDGDTGCGCVSDFVCGCDGDTGCDCVADFVCGCDGDSGCGCVGDYGCGCVGDSGCGCVGDSGPGCGCDGDAG